MESISNVAIDPYRLNHRYPTHPASVSFVKTCWAPILRLVELSVFDEVAELVRAMAPDAIGEVRVRAHRRGVKVWFDTDAAGKEHYEAQVLSRRYIDGTEGMAIEIGFHSEHKDQSKNISVVDHLMTTEKKWRKELGTQPEVDVFYGAENWRRVSETWIEPDLDDEEITFEIASRLVDYVSALQPELPAE